MKKVRLIYNPYSGDNNIIRNLDNIFRIYQNNGYIVCPFRISEEADLSEAFLSHEEYEYFLLAGGDGTINNIVNCMKGLGVDKPIALLPTGTANDFAFCLGMPRDVITACHQIIDSKVREVDLGKINDQYFVNIASMGLFTDVSQKTNVNMKNTMGKLAYYINSLSEIPRFKRLNITVSCEDFFFSDPSLIVFVFNGKSAGNLNIAYKSEVDDGFLDVVIVKGDLGPQTILSFFEFIKGEHLEKPKGVIHLKTDKLTIDSFENIKTDIDGERGPDFPLKITCEKHSLKVLGCKF